jgi:hypothetical protein
MFNRLGRLIPPLALLCLALALPVSASAEVLIACKHATNGKLRVVDDATLCTSSEVAISWNTVGLPGADGPQGPAGPEGPQGPAGPAGPAGPGVTTIAGIVSGETGLPSLLTANGFTSERIGPGYYVITFPPGSFTRFPVVVVTAIGGSAGGPPFAMARVNIISFRNFDGSASVEVGVSQTMPEVTPVDETFSFVAAQSLPAAP